MNWPECGMRIVRVLTLLICISSSEANADPITFSFSVRVTGAHDPEGRLLGQTVAPGDILRGSYTFDSHAVSQVDSSFFGLYSSSLAGGALARRRRLSKKHVQYDPKREG